MRALNGSLTELRPLWHFNRKRGKEELWRVGEGHQLSRGHCAELLCSCTATLPSGAYFEGSGARFTPSPFPQPAQQAGHP